ncbi:MAG: hypothetical protein H7A25_23605 [Leptospiraceae bacterium]|nr:hypothetical protein [Leptospiraceae bacterium]
MKTTNKNYIFKVLALFLPCLFFFNFSLLTGDKLKWKASFPVVKFKVINSDIESNKNYLDIIQAAAKSWSMLETNSHFNFVYDGGSSVSYANFSSDTSCTESLKKADNSIYINESVLDPDCTSFSCSQIWSCEEENDILHFDIQFNKNLFKNAYENNDFIKAKVSHEFGHIVGLGHCSPGETEVECQSRLTGGQTEPLKTDVMYKIPYIIYKPSSVDIAGISYLYGLATDKEIATFNKMKDFYEEIEEQCNVKNCNIPVFSSEEIVAYNNHQSFLITKGYHTEEARLAKNRGFQDLYHSAYSEGAYSAEEHLLISLNELKVKVEKLSKDSLEASVLIVSIQIKDTQRAIELYKNDLDEMYMNFIESELKALIIIREEMKNELVQR